ncbi:Signal transduction histidine kinase [Actinacidiphila yanglinensis]|uniref:Signal transduction histidine kinase n=1 Tax=Actinacidiphila yanglinensis TaxID=310779 RepID=A0A1H6AJF5_9ACTN|nr:sensor histidine kinase [Actinacidiphila yanglinensis]SEG48370.1 Signal transduction histidine kinase [Actinacidiphila yanglinensis]
MSGRELPAMKGGQDERLLPLVTVVPYVLLAALAVVTPVLRHGVGTPPGVDLGLCAATALWILWMFTLHPDWWDRPGVMGLFFAGLVVLIGVLVLRDPWFGLFTPACYFYAFGIVPWPWRMPGVAAVALESGCAQAAGVPKDSAVGLTAFVVVLAVNVICLCGFAWWERNAERVNEAREAALAEAREANRRLRATLAENAGLHRQLLVQAREAGVLDERQRMAREIHDTLAQGLIGIVTQLQAAELAGGVPERGRTHFAAATRLARESLAEARRSVDALRPQPLETAGLGEALAGVAERWSALHGVTVRVTTSGTARPTRPEAELALLRAAQEALANVARHAGATTVSLTLGYQEDEVVLDVRDDGRGFEPAAGRPPAPVLPVPVPAVPVPAVPVPAGSGAGGGPGGFGLEAMRERIEALSGTVRVESAPGSGTTVSARVPHGTAEAGA